MQRVRGTSAARASFMVASSIVPLPFAYGHRPEDIEVLFKRSILAGLDMQSLGAIVEILDQLVLPEGTTIFREGEDGEHAFIVLEGAARLRRGAFDLGRLGPGDHFGELAILGQGRRGVTVIADTSLRLARLSRARFLSMAAKHPRAAIRLVEMIAIALASSATAMSDEASRVLRHHTLPMRTTVRVVVDGVPRDVPAGTVVRALLPATVEGALVVAAAIDQKPVALDASIVAGGVVQPLTVASWEGRRVYRRSVALLLLEAARVVLPGRTLVMGPRQGDAQIVIAEGASLSNEDVALVESKMRELASAGLPLREELWALEEARSCMKDQHWDDAAALLSAYRERAVPLLSCGQTFALGVGPVLPNARELRGFAVTSHSEGLLLHFGAAIHGGTSKTAMTSALSVVRPGMIHPATPQMTRELRTWLETMGVTSVGRFNECCVHGQVEELVRVAEGFHEKHIGRIADAIANERQARVVAIAGPSSSGKTTFIRRLKVQLECNGLVPIHLSLDDYYVDRVRTPRDEDGEYDFEALAAIDLLLLSKQLKALLAGERVKLARYDFVSGKSNPSGGGETVLGPRNVLLVEGLHALAPSILALCESAPSFSVFVQPNTALPFDRLSSVLPEDVRLLRRIVRDRHQRGYSARESIARWPSVRRGEERHVLPFAQVADAVFDSSLVYEVAVLRVYAERYLLEVPPDDPAALTAHRLRLLIDRFVPIHAEHVPRTSLLREFIGGSSFEGP